MYGKKIIASLALVSVVVVSAAMFAAFEAHVINVTAKIENALYVPIDNIDFGTVFPQEELYESFSISLSQSFQDETRVDDVEYIIRQKPKCGWTMDDGTILLGYPTMSGHVNDAGIAECPPVPDNPDVPADATWEQLPLLCPYLSKHKVDVDPDSQNEVQVDAFHQPWYLNDAGELVYTEAKGRLAKSDNDYEDNWVIDLKVPCFGDHCAQDWEDFVYRINPLAVAADYIQPIGNEHKIFGCDLWVEVTEVSETEDEDNGDLGCVDADLMLVLDRSGSIDDGELADLQTAAKAFVTALVPAADKSHIGQTSFATYGSHDLSLTYDVTAIEAAIDGLNNSGRTNLMEGITLATTELVGGDRTPDADYPDYMVVITDGNPNEPGTEANAKLVAAQAADAARAVGIKIYVVGVGTDVDATYLSEEIANSTGQYYSVADYSDLEDILEGIATCNTP
ncbi:VWA domain-containing protein [Candidatus Parcubacteria bacterium]|nr:VWA domain-containing protein [Candidatus Parcubacteria bacterium]